MTRTQQGRRRGGFSLVEMMVAITLTIAVFALTVPFFWAQARTVDRDAGRADAQQNARFAVGHIDKALRNAGVHVLGEQPMIVQAAGDALTFNADLVSTNNVDRQAVYHNPDVDSGAVVAMTAPGIRLPNAPDSRWVYPGVSYGGSAETISYYLQPDSSGGGADVYMLMRRVNHRPAEVVTRDIIVTAGQPAFRYFKADSLGGLMEIPSSVLPLRHSALQHENAADTGRAALIDSIRLVRVRMIGRYRDARGAEVRDTVEHSIRIANAGLLHFAACGEKPAAPSAVEGRARVRSGQPYVEVEWRASGDERAGEKDVERYVIYRRPKGAQQFGEPIASVLAARFTTYAHRDIDVRPGEEWIYGVAAQDCTPAISPTVLSKLVKVDDADDDDDEEDEDDEDEDGNND